MDLILSLIGLASCATLGNKCYEDSRIASRHVSQVSRRILFGMED